MIYLFDKDMGLHKVVKSENVLTPIHEHEMNGLILCNIELGLSYAKKFIDGAEYAGYYYKDVYYLHRIKRVEEIHEEEKLIIAGRHIFFDDMLAYNIIKDFRPQNRDAGYVLSQTIGTHTRWQVVSVDTTKHRSETFYYETPMEVLNKVVEGWQIEYKPEILFDGQRINGFQLHVSERIGKGTHKRIPFGDRVLNLKYEMDYSEISTAVIGRGKGEEVGDGYGRRLEFTDSDFSRDGVVSPVGKNYMENPALTAEYGYDDGQPKFEVVVFDDIESVSDLLDATYAHYLDVSRPKMLFEASVSDLGDVDIGDSLAILRLEYDIAFSVRIHKLSVNLHHPQDAQVELGDYAHFKESKVERKRRNNDRQWKRETTSRIEQMKRDFDADYEGIVQDIQSAYEQAVIDANAETQAAEERMQNEIEGLPNDTPFVDALLTNTLFSNDIKTMSLEAVYADISELRNNLLISNVVKADHIAASHALIDKIFIYDAYISRLTSKTAFIRDIQTIEISADKINGGILASLNGGIAWNLNQNRIDHYESNTTRYHAYGNAATMYKDGWIVGEGYLAGSDGSPRLVIGGNGSATLSPDHPRWNGLDINPADDSLNLTADKFFISSEGGEGSQYLRRIDFEMYRNDNTVRIVPMRGNTNYRYYLGDRYSQFEGVNSRLINGFRIYEDSYGIHLVPQRAGGPLRLSIRDNDVVVMRGSQVLKKLYSD